MVGEHLEKQLKKKNFLDVLSSTPFFLVDVKVSQINKRKNCKVKADKRNIHSFGNLTINYSLHNCM